MIVKKNKIIKISMLLLATTIITHKTPCHAFTVSFGSLSDDQTSNEEIPYEDWSENPMSNNINDKGYVYRYKKQISTDASINMDGYNMNGESVMPKQNVVTDEFKAGTWIGINITEIQKASWKLSNFEYKEIKKLYTCKYSYSGGTTTCNQGSAAMSESSCNAKKEDYDNVSFSQFYPGYGLCTYSDNCSYSGGETTKTHTKDFFESYECDEKIYENGHTYYLNEKESTVENIEGDVLSTSPISENAEQEAIASAQNIAKSLVGGSVGRVNYIQDKKDLSLSPDSITATKIGSLQSSGVGTKNGSYWQEYEYKQEKVCMNVKTAQVTYGRNCKTSEGEIQIENVTLPNNKGKYWHYFIPLSTKTSNKNFYIQVAANPDRKLTVNECKNAMEKYEDYENYIVPYAHAMEGVSNKFLGKDSKEVDENTIVRNEGCYFFTTINIPVVQEFYNEITENNTKKIKGFNFYYKPIDINNPFPNGISDNSLWKKWNESTNKTPNLTESYSTVTYTALDINASNIRNYNSNNLYTDWSNMYLDGTSKFIDDYVVRNGTINVYKLGCGPLNANEYLLDENGNEMFDASGNKIKNKLYMKACGNS